MRGVPDPPGWSPADPPYDLTVELVALTRVPLDMARVRDLAEIGAMIHATGAWARTVEHVRELLRLEVACARKGRRRVRKRI